MILTALAVFLITDALLSFFGGPTSQSISYTEFSKQLGAGNIATWNRSPTSCAAWSPVGA